MLDVRVLRDEEDEECHKHSKISQLYKMLLPSLPAGASQAPMFTQAQATLRMCSLGSSQQRLCRWRQGLKQPSLHKLRLLP